MIPRSGHFLIKSIFDMSIGDPRLLPAVALIFVLFVMVRKIFFKDKSRTRSFEEDLVVYQQALKKRTSQTMITTE